MIQTTWADHAMHSYFAQMDDAVWEKGVNTQLKDLPLIWVSPWSEFLPFCSTHHQPLGCIPRIPIINPLQVDCQAPTAFLKNAHLQRLTACITGNILPVIAGCMQNLSLTELTMVAKLGAGAFGTVSLVRHASNHYALKQMYKSQILQMGLQVWRHPPPPPSLLPPPIYLAHLFCSIKESSHLWCRWNLSKRAHEHSHDRATLSGFLPCCIQAMGLLILVHSKILKAVSVGQWEIARHGIS